MSMGDWIFLIILFSIFFFLAGHEVGKFREHRKIVKDISALKNKLQDDKHYVSGKYILNHHEKQVDHYWDGCWKTLLFCIERVEYYLGKY